MLMLILPDVEALAWADPVGPASRCVRAARGLVLRSRVTLPMALA
jgi:hypothetical protein